MTDHGTAAYTLGQYNEVQIPILRALPKALEGTDPKQVIPVLQSRGEMLESALEKAIASVVKPMGETLMLTLWGQTTSVLELVELGNYGFSLKDLMTDERFPLHKHRPIQRKIELVKFTRSNYVQPLDILSEFTHRDLEQPTYEDALYFGILYPMEQTKHPVVFLHEPVWGPAGGLGILILTKLPTGGRFLNILIMDSHMEFPPSWVFPGIRKS